MVWDLARQVGAPRAASGGLVTATAMVSAGSVAQTLLAGHAGAVIARLRVLHRDPGADEVATAIAALGVLRTELRSLRPILDKRWTVALRDGLDEVAAVLAAVHHLDEQQRLLVECGAETSTAAMQLRDRFARRRGALAATLRRAIDPRTAATLDLLAFGREPAPLRTDAPVGDPALPAAVLLPSMLHRRWRKLAKQTPTDDVESMHRRSVALLVILDAAGRCDLPVFRLWPATDALRVAAAEALRVASAAELADLLPAGRTRTELARIGQARRRTARDVEQALAVVAGLGPALPVDDRGPDKAAAGGLVVRWDRTGPQVLLVHRIRHDDWSLPKGAMAPGETVQEAAVREVREETGLRCRLGAELKSVTYRDRNNRAKHVRFWHMTPVGVAGAPDPAEIDEVRWVPLATAAESLTRKRDRTVVAAFAREHRSDMRAA